ncbi:hypothetical protein N7535_002931 [Penicillium sp. DV-2018c]|nr:hypothetical protein N7535_002931 [Penicillium sp. DV-2018c]
MTSKITPNTFLTTTGSSSASDQKTTIFFISGNPGLIRYYHPFLSLLSRYLDENKDKTSSNLLPQFQIYGSSLGGFEIPEDGSSASSPPRSTNGIDLEDQIRFVQGKLSALVEDNNSKYKYQSQDGIDKEKEKKPKQKIILIGHSVGAYIAMEILRRHREAATSPTGESESDFDIIGGVMLFPTIQDIASSPSGQKLTSLLSIIPRLAVVVGFFARLLTSLLPRSLLRALVGFVMRYPPAHALDATCAFLMSPGGVRQALHMAADEMRTITSDKWSDDVWGAASTGQLVAKLFFYFGRNDHWVADQTRDDVIAARGRKDGEMGPTMVVCEESLPHAFCLNHNDVMARKVAGMIRQIVG